VVAITSTSAVPHQRLGQRLSGQQRTTRHQQPRIRKRPQQRHHRLPVRRARDLRWTQHQSHPKIGLDLLGPNPRKAAQRWSLQRWSFQRWRRLSQASPRLRPPRAQRALAFRPMRAEAAVLAARAAATAAAAAPVAWQARSPRSAVVAAAAFPGSTATTKAAPAPDGAQSTASRPTRRFVLCAASSLTVCPP
jgi:hypothetical protein